jgi:hypothetical protein
MRVTSMWDMPFFRQLGVLEYSVFNTNDMRGC